MPGRSRRAAFVIDRQRCVAEKTSEAADIVGHVDVQQTIDRLVVAYGEVCGGNETIGEVEVAEDAIALGKDLILNAQPAA